MNGWKTYAVAAATAAYGIIGYALGYLDATTMVQFVMAALTAAGLRHGIANG